MDVQDSSNNIHTARTWFQLKCEDSHSRHLWIKARVLYTFRPQTITALYLFEYDAANSEQRNSRNSEQRNSRNSEQRNPQISSQRFLWSAEVHRGIRRLFDRIVTRWVPSYLTQTFRMSSVLHKSLTPENDSPNGSDFDVETAQRRYEKHFVPLLYHELWENIKHDIQPMTPNPLSRTDGDIDIQITNYVPQVTQTTDMSEPPIETTLIFGSYVCQIDLLFIQTLPKLALCDIVLINIDVSYESRTFFAVIVHVVDNWPSDMENVADVSLTGGDKDKHVIQVKSDVVLYASKKCSEAIKCHCHRLGSETISIIKLTNITSSRRQISAIYNLRTFSKQKSLLRPSSTNFYFRNEHLLNDQSETLGNFNEAQMRVINYAERIFGDNGNGIDRLHLVHGPPGTGKSKTIAGIVVRLLPQLGEKRKILLCAPSNNACDELSKRILNELGSDYEKGTLVRVGRESPSDHCVCEHFLESLTMEKLVERMQNEELVTYKTADSIKNEILNNAKVIVSTLNYSANNTLLTIKKQRTIKFIIIDEACQSLEADCLLPFYFGCSKIILVGDLKQLPPCVLSVAGQTHNLSQSLYTRLDATIHRENITLLIRQYRMHEEICQFPSIHFYNDELITDEIPMNYWSDYPLEPYYLYNLIYTQHTRPPGGGSSENKEERIFIKTFCIKLLEHLTGRQPYVKNNEEFIEMEKRIVVITPYKRQMTKFRKNSLQFPRHIEVLTVDSAQGKESDIVLISCVRSDGTIGFLKDQHRLNVMLTRAKRALYIFGNLTMLAEQNPHWDALIDNAQTRQVIDTVRSANEEVNLPF